MTIALPSQEYLSECFDYDTESGVLTWQIRPLHHFKNAHGMNTFNSKYAGSKIISIANSGYFVVRINNRAYLCHRIIWKLVTGIDPVAYIDHRDTNKKNNAWGNLREATKQENAFNQPASPRNKTGYKGVSFCQRDGTFYACIRANGKSLSLGRFETAEMAHAAYVTAAKPIHGIFFRSK